MRRLFDFSTLVPLLFLCSSCSIFSDDTTDRSFTTSNDSGHTHNILIPASVLGSPSSAGYTGTTTSVNDHTHEVDLTQTEIESIAARRSFSIQTTNEDAHDHTVDFK